MVLWWENRLILHTTKHVVDVISTDGPFRSFCGKYVEEIDQEFSDIVFFHQVLALRDFTGLCEECLNHPALQMKSLALTKI